MEKINVAELLKDCPKGMELDCAMYEDVFFDEITNNKIFPICIKRIDGHPVILTKHGGYANCPSSKCVIFPKGKTTWEGFVPPFKFKDGDIIYVKDKYNNEWCSILSNDEDSKLYTYIDFCINNNTFYHNKPNILCGHKDIIEYRLATEEEKEKLFNAIKDNGYKWNPETKILEKLIEPKFKVGDVIKYIDRYKVKITEVNIEDECYRYESMIAKGISSINFSAQDNWELVPNKFDINTLKPFDKVLVRLTNNCVWMPKFFSYYDSGPNVKYYPFVTIDNISYPQCIPYNGNEHLCRKTYNCDDFYKNWK